MRKDDPNSFIKNLLLIYPLTFSYLVTVFAVLFHQFIIIPFFSKYIPSMLKCIWIEIVALLVKSIMTTLISYFIARDIRNAIIINDLFLNLTNNITFRMNNQMNSHYLSI